MTNLEVLKRPSSSRRKAQLRLRAAQAYVSGDELAAANLLAELAGIVWGEQTYGHRPVSEPVSAITKVPSAREVDPAWERLKVLLELIPDSLSASAAAQFPTVDRKRLHDALAACLPQDERQLIAPLGMTPVVDVATVVA